MTAGPTARVPVGMSAGREWMVEAFGCDVDHLTRVVALQSVFSAVVAELGLHPVGDTQWHQFPTPGGITGLCLLAESHLTVHTFPEFGSACFNLFCCTPRAPWDWEARLGALLGASHVVVRSVDRSYQGSPETQRDASKSTAPVVTA